MKTLNRLQISRIQEGKRTDALVAEFVMDWFPVPDSTLWNTPKRETALLSRFSSNPGYLKKIHDKLHCRGWGLQWTPCLRHGYQADFLKNGKRIVGFGKSRSLALCRAALLVRLFEDTGGTR